MPLQGPSCKLRHVTHNRVVKVLNSKWNQHKLYYFSLVKALKA
jgi:hypothetical protein